MVKIVADTTACLPPAVIRQYNLPVIPQIIHLDDQTYREGIDIDHATFMARLKTARELPKTAAPPPELFVEVFAQLVPLGEPILCIHPSAKVSGTVRSAQVARQEFPHADIRVIDTQLIASALGTLVTLACEWAAAGLDADTLTARLTRLSQRNRTYFLVATLEYLARGGRIGGASALLGSMLQIKPILTLQNGQVELYERERTPKRALARLQALVLEQIPRDEPAYLSVMHAGVPEQGQALAAELGAALGLTEVPVVDVPPAIVIHGGPGILAVSFFVKA